LRRRRGGGASGIAVGCLTIGWSDRGLRLRCAKEGVDDRDKSVSFLVGAFPRRSTLSLDATFMRIARFLLDLGGGIFVLLGFLHALYTFLDIRRPRRLVPQDPSVTIAMKASPLRLSRGRTTMWRAWVGFNFSHSVGAVLFGVLCICAGAALGTLVIRAWALLFMVAVSFVYLGLSALYWFRIPTVGIAVASVCLLVAWLMYATAGV
jgi:hypothetical protein